MLINGFVISRNKPISKKPQIIFPRKSNENIKKVSEFETKYFEPELDELQRIRR